MRALIIFEGIQSVIQAKTVGEDAVKREGLVHNGAVMTDTVVAKDGQELKILDVIRLLHHAKTSIVVHQSRSPFSHHQKTRLRNSKTKVAPLDICNSTTIQTWVI